MCVCEPSTTVSYLKITPVGHSFPFNPLKVLQQLGTRSPWRRFCVFKSAKLASTRVLNMSRKQKMENSRAGGEE